MMKEHLFAYILAGLMVAGCSPSPNAGVKVTCSSDGHVQSIEVPGPWMLEKLVKENTAAHLCARTADNSAAAPRPDNQLPTTVNYGQCSITCP